MGLYFLAMCLAPLGRIAVAGSVPSPEVVLPRRHPSGASSYIELSIFPDADPSD